MFSFVILWVVLYTVSGTVSLYGYSRQIVNSKRKGLEKECIQLEEVTVLIPFRNEAANLPSLLGCIVDQKKHPKQYIFIDDHSDDGGIKLIQKLGLDIPYRVLTLMDGEEGKKSAIRKAMDEVDTGYVLTWDSDIQVRDSYFERLSLLPEADMYILPVVMEGKGVLQRFFEMDYNQSNAVNFAVSGLARPFLASGANLLFNRSSFLNCDSINTHKHIASGDDVFLLRDFQKAGKDIRLVLTENLSVKTTSPKTVRAFLEQRLRWIGKGKQVGDHLSNALSALAFLLNVYFLCMLFSGKWELVLMVWFVKTSVDVVSLAPYFKRMHRSKTLLLQPVYSFIYPIYLILLLLLTFKSDLSWKGRVVYKKGYQ
jgi:biofilm PGA synthesis N-glycosyltransferase PgaC